MAIKQLSVFLENKKGTLSEITGLLFREGINLRALTIAETADYGVLRLVADDSEKARSVLQKNDFLVAVNDVAAVTVPDTPGGLYQLLRILAEGEVSVEYMYSIFGQQDNKAFMVMKLDNEEKARKLLRDSGLPPVSAEDLGLH